MNYLIALSLRMGIPIRRLMAEVKSEDLAWYRAYDAASEPKPETTRERALRQLGPGAVKRAR